MAVGPIPVTRPTTAKAAAAAAAKPATASKPAAATPSFSQSLNVYGAPKAPTQTINLYGSPATNTRTSTTSTKTTTPATKTTQPGLGPITGPSNTFIPGYTPSTVSGGATDTFTPAGTFAGYELSADGKQRRARYHDGKGGFYYGAWESVEDEEVKGTTNVQVLKAVLLSKGLPADLVDESVPFLQTLLKEGIDVESAVSIYLNSKDFTTKSGSTITSPFYTKYGFYNAALTEKYDPSTLFNTIEGYKNVQSKYNLDTKFISQDYIQKYLKNKKTVAALDRDANTARLLAVNADPFRVKTLTDLGYINSAQDLTDFYLDPNVGTEKMQQNVNTAAFAIEAIRRANRLSPFSKTAAEQYGAQLTAQGLSEAEVTALASKGYESIAQTLEPLTKTSGMYETQAPGTQMGIQSELEAEQFKGLESERRKRLTEQYIRGLQGQSGITTQSLSTGSILGAV